MSNEIYECPTCHHSSNAYWHGLTPGVVNALIKFKRAVLANGNSIHLLKDMEGKPYELTRHEWNNFTKLRFHGLAVRDDNAGAGYWLLTRRGNDFLKGQIDVPAKVKTMNNHVIDHSSTYVTIEQVLGSKPYFEEVDTLERESLPLDLAQGQLAL